MNVALLLSFTAVVYLAVHFFLFAKPTDKDGNTIPPGPCMRYFSLSHYPERKLDAWAKRYGPLYSFYLGDQLYVIISDVNIARELLVNNGAIFSSRKDYFIKNQSILRGRAITASQYNDKW